MREEGLWPRVQSIRRQERGSGFDLNGFESVIVILFSILIRLEIRPIRVLVEPEPKSDCYHRMT